MSPTKEQNGRSRALPVTHVNWIQKQHPECSTNLHPKEWPRKGPGSKVQGGTQRKGVTRWLSMKRISPGVLGNMSKGKFP